MTINNADEKYKVTLVISIYNFAEYIEIALLSALNQTFTDIEYLLIDNQSTDKSIEITKEIVYKHSRKDDIIIIEHGKNLGAGATRNTGISNARGEYIFFMDGDDELALDAIEKLYQTAKSEDVDFVIGSYISRDCMNTGKKWEWIFNYQTIKKEFGVAEQYFKGKFYVMLWNKLIRTIFLRENNIKCIDYHIHNQDDIIFSFQLALNAFSMTSIPNITYYYIFRNESITNFYKYKEKYFEDYCITFNYMINYSKKYLGTKIYPQIIYYMYGFRYSILKELNLNKSISKSFKEEYLKKLSSPILNITEIWNLSKTKVIHRIKYSISFLPYKIQLYLLDLINYLYKKTNRY